MLHSIQVQFFNLHQNLSGKMTKVHKIQKILIRILILILKRNSPFQEGIISEMFQTPDKSFFQEPKELGDLINKENFIHNYLPKQTDIDKILEIMQRKSTKRDTFTNQDKGNTDRLSMQPIFQRVSIYIYYKINFHLLNQQLEK